MSVNKNQETDQLAQWRARHEPFHILMKRLRSQVEMTQEQVGREVGVNKAYISMIEGGKRVPSPPLLKKLAGLYQVSFYDLLQRAGYIFPRTVKAERQYSKHRDLIESDPSFRSRTEALRRIFAAVDPKRLVAFMEAGMEDPYEGPVIRSILTAREPIEDQVETLLTQALSDPEVPYAKRFRKQPPNLPVHVKGIIAGLYRMYRTERKLRESIQSLVDDRISELWDHWEPKK